MAVEIRMPQLTLTMSEAKVVRWCKREGEEVEKGQPLLEVETDKAVVEIEAVASGHLLQILAREGEVVQVDELLAVIGQPGEKVKLTEPSSPAVIQPAAASLVAGGEAKAKLAAPAIEDSLLRGEARLQNYQKAIDEKIMPEIRVARVLSRMFVRFPLFVFKMLNRDERIWRGCCYLLRQEIDYSTIKQRLGGFKGVYSLLMGK